MSSLNALKRLLVASSVVLGVCSTPAMAEQGRRRLRRNQKIDCNLFALAALLEMLRRETGATEIRVEEPGKGYTKEYNADRLRVIVDENNLMQSFMCG